ncbi:MAG: PilN domain-containing protein [Chitinispirillales bacterium]|jgi:Tfp pilus assembly protein PilN|nr:PilN domain-containing protein [Chitinispirillales bacterium]
MKTTSSTERKNKKRVTGVIHTQDGSIVCAKLKIKNGCWKIKTAQWPVSKVFKTALTLSNGAQSALHAQWHRTLPDAELEPPLRAPNSDTALTPYLDPQRTSIILEALSGQLTSIVTEDSFLLTFPLAFRKEAPPSFLSVFCEDGIVTFGVVTARKLEAVFSFPQSGVSCVEASAARIRRYWVHVLKRGDFPQKAFVLDRDSKISECDGLEVEKLTLPKELYDSSAMKAAGAALTALYHAPAFKVPDERRFKIHRPLLLKAAAVLLCVSLVTALVPAAANIHAERKLGRSENIYNTKLNENKALQNLEKTAGELSAKVLSIKKTYAQSSRWGNLLQLLGEIKPDDLFLERLGSDQIQGSENRVRIALSGWSRSETSVTEFISSLQKSGFISGASLASIERDAKNKNICRFRVLCTMQPQND